MRLKKEHSKRNVPTPWSRHRRARLYGCELCKQGFEQGTGVVAEVYRGGLLATTLMPDILEAVLNKTWYCAKRRTVPVPTAHQCHPDSDPKQIRQSEALGIQFAMSYGLLGLSCSLMHISKYEFPLGSECICDLQ